MVEALLAKPSLQWFLSHASDIFFEKFLYLTIVKFDFLISYIHHKVVGDQCISSFLLRIVLTTIGQYLLGHCLFGHLLRNSHNF